MKRIQDNDTVMDGVQRLGGDHRKDSTKAGKTTALAASVLLTLAGCATDQVLRKSCPDACPDYCETDCIPEESGQATSIVKLADWRRCVEPLPHDATPAPPGTYINAWREAQTTAAMQRNWVITRNLWFSGGEQLSPDGARQLARIAVAMQETPNWVVIETEPVQPERGETYDESLERIDQLQQRRRLKVVETLARNGVPDAEQWVIFADDQSVGVRGIEAPQIFNRQFQGFGVRAGRRGQQGGLGVGGFGGGLGGGGLGGGIGGGLGGGGILGGGGFGGGGIF